MSKSKSKMPSKKKIMNIVQEEQDFDIGNETFDDEPNQLVFDDEPNSEQQEKNHRSLKMQISHYFY